MRRSWTSSLPGYPEQCHDKNTSQASSGVVECHVPWLCPPHGPKMASESVSKGQQTHSWHLRQDFLVRERVREREYCMCVFRARGDGMFDKK